ncbi:hypothetical protein SAMN02746066_04347 [Anaerosporobacter mobilis DSM 15930]|uniref:Uncharacterized protein n=1 Tax=Anaerosporobacter mobilis DSM 15930 TaxID=1120996 RepID=A0A1M7NAL7_9FIRM|nr:hypothetical protein [Anaerosporobacter mobilis]SHN00694.1 hypothetical protein SAMN02746066_04347 [Anaerosporobacter mobilis DSM 15930]
MKKVQYTTHSYLYKRINNEDWYVDIVLKSDCYEIWLYAKTYSHKMFVLGFPTNSGISLAGMEAAVEDILEDGSYQTQYKMEIEVLES